MHGLKILDEFETALVGQCDVRDDEVGRLAGENFQRIVRAGRGDDVQLRGGTGFDLVPHVRPGARIIFITAYDQHALRVVDHRAGDAQLARDAPRGGPEPDALHRAAHADLLAGQARLRPLVGALFLRRLVALRGQRRTHVGTRYRAKMVRTLPCVFVSQVLKLLRWLLSC